MRILHPLLPALAIALAAVCIAGCDGADGAEFNGQSKAADVTTADVGGGEEADGGQAFDDVRSFCGDGHADALSGPFAEQCDGADLRGATCETLGLPAGRLACAANCSAYDTRACLGEDVCGNEILEEGEACDWGPAPPRTCRYGVAECQVCDASCTLVPGITSVCGDGVRDATNEVCEADDLGGLGCEDVGFVSGELSCSESCLLDPSDCVRPVCGNGVLEDGEACDDGDQNVEWFCEPGDETCCRSDCQLGEPAPSVADDVVADAGPSDGNTDVGSDVPLGPEGGTGGDVRVEADADGNSNEGAAADAGHARPPVDEKGCAASAATPGLAWGLFALCGLTRRRRPCCPQASHLLENDVHSRVKP